VYSADLLDHFQNPRNAGEIEAPDRTARLENPVCGDILELTLRLDGDGNGDGSDHDASNAPKRISDIRFRAKGCVPVMACASALTELVKGRTLLAARQVSREDVTRKVGGLPQASTHASHLAVDALAQLLRDL
jgi:nitrogen fixation NifU-like protein